MDAHFNSQQYLPNQFYLAQQQQHPHSQQPIPPHPIPTQQLQQQLHMNPNQLQFGAFGAPDAASSGNNAFTSPHATFSPHTLNSTTTTTTSKQDDFVVPDTLALIQRTLQQRQQQAAAYGAVFSLQQPSPVHQTAATTGIQLNNGCGGTGAGGSLFVDPQLLRFHTDEVDDTSSTHAPPSSCCPTLDTPVLFHELSNDSIYHDDDCSNLSYASATMMEDAPEDDHNAPNTPVDLSQLHNDSSVASLVEDSGADYEESSSPSPKQKQQQQQQQSRPRTRLQRRRVVSSPTAPTATGTDNGTGTTEATTSPSSGARDFAGDRRQQNSGQQQGRSSRQQSSRKRRAQNRDESCDEEEDMHQEDGHSPISPPATDASNKSEPPDIELFWKNAKARKSCFSTEFPEIFLISPYKYDFMIKVAPGAESAKAHLSQMELELVYAATLTRPTTKKQDLIIERDDTQDNERILRIKLNLCSFHFKRKQFRICVSYTDSESGQKVRIFTQPFRTLARRKDDNVDDHLPVHEAVVKKKHNHVDADNNVITIIPAFRDDSEDHDHDHDDDDNNDDDSNMNSNYYSTTSSSPKTPTMTTRSSRSRSSKRERRTRSSSSSSSSPSQATGDDHDHDADDDEASRDAHHHHHHSHHSHHEQGIAAATWPISARIDSLTMSILDNTVKLFKEMTSEERVSFAYVLARQLNSNEKSKLLKQLS